MRDYAELITRLKQSDDNCNAECCECSGECLSSGCNIFSEAAVAIEELVAKVPHWISVEERLPEKYESVITANKNGDVRRNYLINEKYGTWSNGYHITHWMPLPEPPTKTLEKAHKEFMKKVNEANAVSYARRVKQQSEEARKLREEIEKLDGCKVPEPPKGVE